MCGAALSMAKPQSAKNGLSPRVRGSQGVQNLFENQARSIPACAGQPTILSPPNPHIRVYPRVCGAAITLSLSSTAWSGLSPRVRGSRVTALDRVNRIRSIPACAGQPAGIDVLVCEHKVYPRVCGAAAFTSTFQQAIEGLSPRVRGSLAQAQGSTVRGRSIPACAGQPGAGSRINGSRKVYPRVCGAAGQTTSVRRLPDGLSPRVRGSRLAILSAPAVGRSIPACAGQPQPITIAARMTGVYPRVCGAARVAPHTLNPSSGLSPRVRGSQ